MPTIQRVLGMAGFGTAVVYAFLGTYTGEWTTAFMGVALAWVGVFLLQ
jgi:hypothetical protein